MSDIIWLLAGNAIFWLGLGIYCLFLGMKQKKLQENIQQMEVLHNDKDQ